MPTFIKDKQIISLNLNKLKQSGATTENAFIKWNGTNWVPYQNPAKEYGLGWNIGTANEITSLNLTTLVNGIYSFGLGTTGSPDITKSGTVIIERSVPGHITQKVQITDTTDIVELYFRHYKMGLGTWTPWVRGIHSGNVSEFETPSVTSIDIASTDLSISGAPITSSGTITLNINPGAVTLSKIQNFNAYSVLGRPSSTTGVSSFITAADNTVLRRTGTSFAFGKIGNAHIMDLDWSKIIGAPSINNGILTINTGGIATGLVTFSANQSTDASITINVPGTNIGATLSGNTLTITSSTGSSGVVDLSPLITPTPTLQQVTTAGNITNTGIVLRNFSNGTSTTPTDSKLITIRNATGTTPENYDIGIYSLNSHGSNYRHWLKITVRDALGTVGEKDAFLLNWDRQPTFHFLEGTGTRSVVATSSGALTTMPYTSGTVTSITAGNGMDFTSITVSGAITLGTPSNITLASTNSVSGTTHTHAFAPGGTSSQYIRGDGSLATFPTIPTPNLQQVTDVGYTTTNPFVKTVGTTHKIVTNPIAHHTLNSTTGIIEVRHPIVSGNTFVEMEITVNGYQSASTRIAKYILSFYATGDSINGTWNLRAIVYGSNIPTGGYIVRVGVNSGEYVVMIGDVTTSWNNSSSGIAIEVDKVRLSHNDANNVSWNSGWIIAKNVTDITGYSPVITIPTTVLGSGTVTSVGLTGSGAISFSGSPITTSGTITTAWGGTTSQYIRGDGTLATFPTIPAGTVTSITIGNGLTGTSPITDTGTITLGTPSNISTSSTNSVSASSHTHALVLGGTSAQYLRGDGSLETFPTIPVDTNFATTNLTFTSTRIHDANSKVLRIQNLTSADFFDAPLGSGAGFNIKFGGSGAANIKTTLLTTGRSYQMPDDNGTIALTSMIIDLFTLNAYQYGIPRDATGWLGMHTRGGRASKSQLIAAANTSLSSDIEHVIRLNTATTNYNLSLPDPNSFPDRVVTISNNSTVTNATQSKIIFGSNIPYISSTATISELIPVGAFAPQLTAKWSITIKSISGRWYVVSSN